MSATLVPSLEHGQYVKSRNLRDLDAFEEFFWLLEQSIPVFHTIIAEVKGTTTIEQWESALDAVEARYPLLPASIGKFRGKRPFFQKLPGVSMPLRIAPLTDSLVLEEEMENELQKPFGDGSGPLTRATLFHARDRAVVLFATHHSSLDGKSHLLLVQDLWLPSRARIWGSNLRYGPAWAIAWIAGSCGLCKEVIRKIGCPGGWGRC